MMWCRSGQAFSENFEFAIGEYDRNWIIVIVVVKSNIEGVVFRKDVNDLSFALRCHDSVANRESICGPCDVVIVIVVICKRRRKGRKGKRTRSGRAMLNDGGFDGFVASNWEGGVVHDWSSESGRYVSAAK